MIIKDVAKMAKVNGTLLRELIESNGFNQESFAKAVGKHPSYINKLVNNRVDCSLKTLSMMASKLGVSAKLLIKEE